VVAIPLGKPAFSGELTSIAVQTDIGQVSNVITFIKPERVATDSQRPSPEQEALSKLDARILEGVAMGPAPCGWPATCSCPGRASSTT